ncbi:MAG: SH3 domain-containing protein [Verrucomicrobiota bacterium]
MKIASLPAFLAALAMGLAAAPASAADTAVVKEDRLNVRGQATLNSEVITQLRKGETVTVHEVVTAKAPKPGDPARWARISLPPNTPVWVSAQFVKDSIVTATRLNIRSGPAERFSILGRVDKGARVAEIRTMEDWMEIIAPEGTFAFVAADFLDIQGAAPAAKPDPSVKPDNVAPPTPEPPAPPPITVVETVKPANAPAAAVDPAPVVPATPKPAPVPVTEPPPAPEPVVAKPAPLPADVKIEPAPPLDEPLPKRIVTREGIVRRSISIQAPTDFRLVEDESGRTINYLFTGQTGLELKWFSGKKIRISGEEAIDKRWPNTPMIEIKTLEPLN